MLDDKQARENTPGVYAELVDRLYAQSEVSRGEGWDEVAKLDADAGKVIESLSAQVAELQKVNKAVEDTCSHYVQRAEAAEAQVAELKHHLALAGYQEDVSYDDEIYEVMTEFNDEIGSIAHELIQSRAQVAELQKKLAPKVESPDCPHATPHRYCAVCPVSPCPIGLHQ